MPRYSQFTELSPLGQSILTGQQNVANTVLPYANILSNTAGYGANMPLNFDSVYRDILRSPSTAGHSLDTGLSGQIQSLPGRIADYNQFDSTISGAPGSIANLRTPYDSILSGTPGEIRNLSTPYDATLNQGPQLLSQNVTDAIYRKSASFLDPQFADQRRDLENQLSRQGIPVGSDAYNNSMREFDAAKTQAYDSARSDAIAGGSQAASNLFNMALAGKGQAIGQRQAAFEAAMGGKGQQLGQLDQALQAALSGKQSGLGQLQAALQAAMSGQGLYNAQQNQMFNQGLSGQQQYVSEQQTAQRNPIDLLQALLGAAPQTSAQPLATPVPSQVAPTDVIGAQGISQNAQNAAYQSNVAQRNAAIGGGAALAGTAATIGIAI